MNNALTDQDGAIIDRLRALQAQHQAGAISITEFDTAFQALHREAGELCACGRDVVSLLADDGSSICAACWLAGAVR